MSGVVILLSKQTWIQLGGFASGFLGVDNAIHQAARDHGHRVYLMEGVYVYHWYRADAVGNGEVPKSTGNAYSRHERDQLPDDGSQATLDGAGLGLGRVSFSGHRVLLIGRDVGAAAEHLKSRNPAALSVVEMDKSALEGTLRHCGTARFADETGNGLDFASGSLRCDRGLWSSRAVRRPEHFLKRLNDWLVTGGRLITAIRTVRSLPIVEGILAGRWLAGGDVAEACRPIRFYTLREVEKL